MIQKFILLLLSLGSVAWGQLTPSFQSETVVRALHKQLKLESMPILEGLELIQQADREVFRFSIRQADKVSGLGAAVVLISGPAGFLKASEKLPVVFVVAGFQTGMQSIAFIKNPGKRILVGFEYPHGPEVLMKQPDLILSSIYRTPPQMHLALSWLKNQAWVDHTRIDLISVSLGTLFLPVTMRLLELSDIKIRNTVFAFGGAEFASVFKSYLKGKVSQQWIDYITQTIQILTGPYSPELHLPFLKSRFLVIRALQDEVFPESSGMLLQDLLPQPKHVELFNTKHINVHEYEIIQRTLNTIDEFLNENSKF